MNALGNTRDEEQHLMLPGGRVGFLLMHGLAGTPVELRFVAQGLARAGYTVYCPLLAGHGGSDLMLATTRWTDWLESGERAFERLREHCDHIVVGGLSAGSMVALHLAARRQSETAGLVLYSPTFWPNGWAMPWYFPAFRLIKQKWLANLVCLHTTAPYGIKDDRIRRFVLESLQSGGRPLDEIFSRRGGTVFEFNRMTRAARRVLGDISLPTFVCHAREDDQSHLSNALSLIQGLKGPVETLILDDSYHMITLDRQRTMVVDRTLAFLDRLDVSQAPSMPQRAGAQGSSLPASSGLNVVGGPSSSR
jgi:carboxylesterase